MDLVWQELVHEVGDVASLARISLRLLLAAVLGGIVGLEREHAGQAAGWRTHILVTIASAVFVMAIHESGGSPSDMSRVMQGVATGIGFVGAGTIIKLSEGARVKGLATAASVWLCSALGIAIGAGRIWLPILGAGLGWFTLSYLLRVERRIVGDDPDHDT
jgi:putative Mg2+ transporter-C (MgtC) family protein